MTKRFTVKASDYTERLADLQARKRELRTQLQTLVEEETQLIAFLTSFYDQGSTEVELASGKTLNVNYSVTERQYLDHEKAIALLTRAGKKVPYFTSEVLSFRVKE